MMQKMNFPSRLRKIRGVLQKRKLDVFVLFTREGENRNVPYLSGFSGTAAALLVTRRNAFIAVDPRYSGRARAEAGMFTIIDLKARQRFSDIIRDVLKRIPARQKKRVGFEGHRVPFLTVRAWKRRIPAQMIPLEDIVGRQRQYKDEAEVAALLHACRVTSDVFQEVATRIKHGMSERDMARDLDNTLRNRGAVGNSFDTIVASGPNAAIPHHNTGDRTLRPGEPVVMDFGGRFPSGYCSDLTRTIFVPGKKPDPLMLRIYGIVLAANRAAFRALRPGMKWKEYDAVARSHIARHGYGKEFAHSLGHSLGLEAHDPYDCQHDAIRVGTVLTDEPGIYIEGRGGVRIEDDIVMTANGPRRLTNAPYIE